MLFLFIFSISDTVQTKVVYFKGDTVIYVENKKMVIIKGNGVIEYSDMRLHADSIVFHTDSRLLDVYRKVVFTSKTDNVEGERLEYSLNSKKAIMYKARTQVEKGYYSGSAVYMVEDNVLYVRNGYYTTCDKLPPHYYFFSPEMKVYLNDMVIARHIILTVHRIPIAYAPFWFFPVGDKRKSGILPFKYGSSTYEGKFFKGLAYYFVINDFSDITFSMDIMEKKGLRPYIEGVWVVRPVAQGNINASYIKETDTGNERWFVNAKDMGLLPYGLRYSALVDWESDRNYVSQYSDTTDLWLKKESYSQVSLSKSFPFLSTNIFMDRRDNFVDSSITINIPNASFSIMPLRWKSYYLSSGFLFKRNIYTIDTTEETKTMFGGNISQGVNIKLFKYFLTGASINYNETLYLEDSVYYTGLYSFNMSVSTALYKIYMFPFSFLRAMLHTLRPGIALSVIPDTKELAFVSLPQPSVKSGIVNLSLNSSFQGKSGVGQERKFTILTSSLNTGVNLLTDSLLPVGLSMNLPFKRLSVSSQISYNVYTYEYAYTFYYRGSLGRFMFPLPFKDSTRVGITALHVNQSFDRDGFKNIYVGGALIPYPSWNVNFNLSYNPENKKLVNWGINVRKDLHCWEAIFTYQQFGEVSKWDIMVRIKALPEVKIGKGLFGFILPE